jgi:hypothetical protein
MGKHSVTDWYTTSNIEYVKHNHKCKKLFARSLWRHGELNLAAVEFNLREMVKRLKSEAKFIFEVFKT